MPSQRLCVCLVWALAVWKGAVAQNLTASPARAVAPSSAIAPSPAVVPSSAVAPSSAAAVAPSPVAPSSDTSPTPMSVLLATCDDELSQATQCVTNNANTNLPLTSLACTACQDRNEPTVATGLAIAKVACDAAALRQAVTEQLLVCQAECFPPDDTCSHVTLEASICAAMELVTDLAAEQSVQCKGNDNASTSGAWRGTLALTWLCWVHIAV